MGTLNYDDVDKLRDAIAAVPRFAIAAYKKAMMEALKLLQGAVQEYPPASDGNQRGRYSIKTHKPMGYYERGAGWWYPVKKRSSIPTPKKSLGQVLLSARMQKAMGGQVVGYKLLRVSEFLGRSWAREVDTSGTSIIGLLGNNASYVDFVQGDQQAAFHRGRGWTTVADAFKKEEKRILEKFNEANDAIIAEAMKP